MTVTVTVTVTLTLTLILARRLQPDSEEVAEYLVRWKGYSEVSPTLTLTLTQGQG